mmetsp:Transcript_24377/g.63320  ORF Transcript_24377/g.63320 Transcript_24377/m.63320 type:complete len:218 (-) Transcript_24377:274-927(-)
MACSLVADFDACGRPDLFSALSSATMRASSVSCICWLQVRTPSRPGMWRARRSRCATPAGLLAGLLPVAPAGCIDTKGLSPRATAVPAGAVSCPMLGDFSGSSLIWGRSLGGASPSRSHSSNRSACSSGASVLTQRTSFCGSSESCGCPGVASRSSATSMKHRSPSPPSAPCQRAESCRVSGIAAAPQTPGSDSAPPSAITTTVTLSCVFLRVSRST